jgi:DNA-binding transcriptional MerR regulator
MDGLSIEELADLAGIPVRTVRYYITQGLLPGPGARGRAATYSEEHRWRLLLIRKLVDQRVPLIEIRHKLEGLTLMELRSLVAEEDDRSSTLRLAEQSPSPREYVAALLQRARSRREPSPPAPPGLASPMMNLPLAPARPESWERYQIVPGVELHVHASARSQYRRLIERLLAAGRSGALDGAFRPGSGGQQKEQEVPDELKQ